MTARAVVVGINSYPNLNKPLQGAVADAVDFASWAIDAAGGGVDPDHLYFWAYPPPAAMPAAMARYAGAARPWPRNPRPLFDQPPTKQLLITALRAAAGEAATAQEDSGEPRRLYVFLAGHGAMTRRSGTDKDPQNCFLTGDYEPGEGSFGMIPLDDLRRLLEMRGPAEVLVFCDCCRNELPLTVPAPVLETVELEDLALNEQWLIGRAAAPGAIAWETPLEKPARGAFTRMLVQALRQYRVDGQLTLPELRGFMKYGVGVDVRPRSQVPKFSLKDEDEAFVITAGSPVGPLPELRLTFASGQAGEVQLLGGQPGETASGQIVDGEVVLTLAPGQYTIEHEASGLEQSVFHTGPGTTHVEF